MALLRAVPPTPDEFVDAHAAPLAALLRALTKPISPRDAGELLAQRARYSAVDLTVVDWGGALVIAADGDFQSDIELFKLGVFQLLRYRLLDRSIEASLRRLRLTLADKRFGLRPASNRTLEEVIEQRLALLLDFEKLDQSLLLIGDWYSARVYRLVVEQFYLTEWKAAVSAQLDSLAGIDATIHESLAFSWRRLLDTIQFVGWLVLLVGYFVLFFLDLRAR